MGEPNTENSVLTCDSCRNFAPGSTSSGVCARNDKERYADSRACGHYDPRSDARTMDTDRTGHQPNPARAHAAHRTRQTERAAAQAKRRAERAAGQRARRETDRERMIAQLDAMATDAEIDERIDELGQRHRDIGAVVALSVLAVALIALLTSLAYYPTIAAQLHLRPHPGVWPYVTAVACFLPLLLRRERPTLALILTSALAGFYLAMPWPPAIVILAPMSALFTVAERYGGRRALPIGIVLGAVVLGVSAMTVSVSYTVTQVVAVFALLGLAAVLGHTARQRRELFEEVREKRLEENRRREEEARRRLEEERLGIARDVHDIMAHSLTLMTLQADAGLTAPGDAEKAATAFAVIGDTGRATLRDLRAMLAVIAGDAGPESPREPLADLTHLDELVRSVRETGLDITLSVDGDLTSMPSAVSVSAYRIVQEALTNIVRHAQASHASVTLRIDASTLALRVTDDGVGGVPSSEGGRGLLGMAERAEVLGGTISAGPAEGGGFEVQGTLPLTRSAT